MEVPDFFLLRLKEDCLLENCKLLAEVRVHKHWVPHYNRAELGDVYGFPLFDRDRGWVEILCLHIGRADVTNKSSTA